ncbi:MAG: hypothetical protein WC527_07355 [Candidatus Margulisiibacteriota bacterium]
MQSRVMSVLTRPYASIRTRLVRPVMESRGFISLRQTVSIAAVTSASAGVGAAVCEGLYSHMPAELPDTLLNNSHTIGGTVAGVTTLAVLSLALSIRKGMRLSSENTKQAKTIATQSGEILKKDKIVEGLDREIVERNENVARLNKRVQGLDSELISLNDQLSMLERLERDLYLDLIPRQVAASLAERIFVITGGKAGNTQLLDRLHQTVLPRIFESDPAVEGEKFGRAIYTMSPMNTDPMELITALYRDRMEEWGCTRAIIADWKRETAENLIVRAVERAEACDMDDLDGLRGIVELINQAKTEQLNVVIPEKLLQVEQRLLELEGKNMEAEESPVLLLAANDDESLTFEDDTAYESPAVEADTEEVEQPTVSTAKVGDGIPAWLPGRVAEEQAAAQKAAARTEDVSEAQT